MPASAVPGARSKCGETADSKAWEVDDACGKGVEDGEPRACHELDVCVELIRDAEEQRVSCGKWIDGEPEACRGLDACVKNDNDEEPGACHELKARVELGWDVEMQGVGPQERSPA